MNKIINKRIAFNYNSFSKNETQVRDQVTTADW